MSEILELIDDFRLNQQIQERKPAYIDVCTYRLKRWYDFILNEFRIEEVEDVQPLHMKKYVQHCQQL